MKKLSKAHFASVLLQISSLHSAEKAQQMAAVANGEDEETRSMSRFRRNPFLNELRRVALQCRDRPCHAMPQAAWKICLTRRFTICVDSDENRTADSVCNSDEAGAADSVV